MKSFSGMLFKIVHGFSLKSRLVRLIGNLKIHMGGFCVYRARVNLTSSVCRAIGQTAECQHCCTFGLPQVADYIPAKHDALLLSAELNAANVLHHSQTFCK